MNHAACVLAMTCLSVAAAADAARGQCQANELVKLLASDGTLGDQFGFSAAIAGDTAVIGARYGDGNQADSGAAYVFGFDGAAWTQEAKLTAADGAADDAFGRTVAVWVGAPSLRSKGGGRITPERSVRNATSPRGLRPPPFAYGEGWGTTWVVVGAARADAAGTDSGAAYVFGYDGQSWTQEPTLVGDDTTSSNNFGYSVAIWGDVVVIGARAHNGFAGAVYVFRYDGQGWVQEQKLTASDGAGGDQFGHTVAIHDATIAVGAYSDDNENGTDAGAVYTFTFDGSSWGQQDKLRADDGANQDFFGWSVDVWGDTAVVGAYSDDDNGAQAGSAYVFRFIPGAPGAWVQEQHLLASDGAVGDRFGYTVATSGDMVVIGAYLDDDNGGSSGSAYVFGFDTSTWTERAKLLATDGAQGDGLALSVGLSGPTMVAGASKDDDNGSNAGSAYVFAALGDCNANDALDLCELTAGSSQDYNANGIPDECEAVVPALSQWGMMVMALALVLAGSAVVRRLPRR